MLVVADSSPLIALINIEHVDLLPRLFGEIVIPPEITTELRAANRPPAVRQFLTTSPAWLIERVPAVIEPIPALHAGERAAISLARELKADLLLIDETMGRQAARERRIPITGTIGVLELAADRKLLDLAGAFERIKKTDFWVSAELLDERLALYRNRGTA